MTERNSALVRKKYNSLLVSTLAMTASLYLSSILDGIMVGRILGPLSFSAINLTYSISFLKNIPIALFTYGGNTLAVMYMGKRENKKANAVFTLSFLAAVVTSVLLAVIGIALAQPTAVFLSQGKAELQSLIRDYLIPLWALTPLTAIVNMTAAFARTDDQKKLATALPVVSNAVNLSCNYLFMSVLRLGVAGAGWATVAGYGVGSVLSLIYYRSSNRSVFFTRGAFRQLRELGAIFSAGLPSSLIYVCNFLRLFFTNSIILSATGTTGTQIASVSFSLNSLCFIFVEGASMTLLPLLGAFYGEKDIKGQRLALRYGLLITTALCIGVLAVSELFPAQLAALYGLKEPAVVAVFEKTFRIMSVNIPILGFIYVMRTFFQATKQKGLANLLVILDGFAAVVPLMWALSKINIYWLWASFPISKAVTVLVTVAAVVAVKKIRHKSNYLLLDGQEGAVLDISVGNTVEEAVETSKRVIAFCAEQGVDGATATQIGVAAEELCVNIAKYARTSKGTGTDVFLKITDSSVILKLRDDGDIFNPTEYVDDSGKAITGIKMVRAVTSGIEYNRVIGFNVTVVTVPLAS